MKNESVMTVTVVHPVSVLDISKKCRLREVRVTVKPGNYKLVEVPNTCAPGVKFFALPDTEAGAVRYWWKLMAQGGFVRINSSDEDPILNQEQIFDILREAANTGCGQNRRSELFKLLFPDFSEKDKILQNPESSRNLAGGIIHNLLFDNPSSDPQNVIGLIPLIVAVLCERTTASPFATVDWKRLEKQSLT